MEEIKNINLEITKLEKEIEEKRKEIIKAKLREIEQNGVSEQTKFNEEETELLKRFVEGKDSYHLSVLMQTEIKYIFFEEQIDEDGEISYETEEFPFYFVRIGNKIYSPLNNQFINQDDIIDEKDNCIGFGCSYIRNDFGSKEELTKPLNIEKLFIDEKLKQPENNIIDIQELGAKIGMEEKEQKLPNGKVINTLLWDQENLLKAVKEVSHFSEEGKPVIITGAAPAWLVSALTHAVHPCPVSVYVPQIGKNIDIPNLIQGEKNPEGEVNFKVTKKGESILVEYNMELPESFTSYDENNVTKVVVPEIPQGKDVYISGRGPNYLTVAIAEAYAHTNSSVSLFQPGIGYTCSITHSRNKKLGDLTKDPLIKEEIKENLSTAKEHNVKRVGEEH